LKFLVVDDSATMRRIIINVLKRIGHDQVVEADHGENALKRLAEGGVEFIITDWNMPVMSGYDLILAVRTQDRQIPILMVTTAAAKDDIIQAVAAGASDYVVKPFLPETLEAKINKMLMA